MRPGTYSSSPCRRLVWLPPWHHPTSLSWYRNVMGLEITQRRRNGYWVAHFRELVTQGSKPEGCSQPQKKIRKPEAVSLHFVLIFYTFSLWLSSRAFCQTKLSSKVTLVLLWRAVGPEVEMDAMTCWPVKAADIIMTYIAYIILCQHVSPLQLNFYFYMDLADFFIKMFPC